MSESAIHVAGLGKQYQIGAREPYYTLRESLSNAVLASLGRFPTIFRSAGRCVERSSVTRSPNSSLDKFIWALKNVSFDVKRGEVVGVIGRNGAGKSTLLKILCRITRPTEGEVKVFGRVGSLLEVGTGFHPELSGRENIYLNGAILGMRRVEINQKFDDIVAFAEVDKFIDTPVKRYSTGMYLRLAFAVAAHLQSEILLVDEVLAVGDAVFQKKCLGRIGNVTKEGRTVLLVSHNTEAIRALCNQTIWIDGGQIVRHGPTSDVVQSYEDHRLESPGKFTRFVQRNDSALQKSTFHFSCVEMLGADGKETAVFKYGEHIFVTVYFAGEPISNQNSLEFRIFGEVGDPQKSVRFIAVGASGPFHGIYFSRQTRKIRIEIGPLNLSNGKYTLSLSMISGSTRTDTWSDICSFTVVDCQPFAQGHSISAIGCVVPHSFVRIE